LLKQELAAANIPTFATESQIVSIKVGDTKQTLQIADYLKNHGIFAPAIRPPTVPTARIRLTVMSTHSASQIYTLVNGLKNAILGTKD
jgi:8-amino-7-oxononanoate synthase